MGKPKKMSPIYPCQTVKSLTAEIHIFPFYLLSGVDRRVEKERKIIKGQCHSDVVCLANKMSSRHAFMHEAK